MTVLGKGDTTSSSAHLSLGDITMPPIPSALHTRTKVLPDPQSSNLQLAQLGQQSRQCHVHLRSAHLVFCPPPPRCYPFCKRCDHSFQKFSLAFFLCLSLVFSGCDPCKTPSQIHQTVALGRGFCARLFFLHCMRDKHLGLCQCLRDPFW